MSVFFCQKNLIVTPNERQALALWQADAALHQEQGETAWETLPACSWSEFLKSLWEEHWLAGLFDDPPATLLNEWQERFLWMKVVRESKMGEELLNLPAAAQLARKAWQLANSYLLEKELFQPGHYWPPDTVVFLHWAEAFRQECARHNWVEPGRLEAEICEILRQELVPARALPTTITFSGFAEWTPAQSDLLKALAECGVEIKEDLPNDPPELERWRLLDCTDSESELRLAARWLRSKLEGKGGRNLKVGLVIPDLTARRSEVSRVLTEVFQPSHTLSFQANQEKTHDISAGLPLTHWPVVEDALSLLALNGKYRPLDAWKVLFHSPFLSQAEWESSARTTTWEKLRRQGRFRVSWNRVEQLCGPIDPEPENGPRNRCPDLFNRLLRLRDLLEETPDRQLPSDWSSTFSQHLEILGWPGQRSLDSAEYQTVGRWKNCLAQLGSLDRLLGKVPRQRAFEALKRITDESVYQPKVSTGQVEVMGTLEAVGLEFDYLWLAGFHDAVWPAASKPNPYLPFSLQRDHKVAHSTPERELDFARIVTQSLLRGSRLGGVVSYPRYSDDQHCRPSPLFQQIETATEADLGLDPESASLTVASWESQTQEILEDEGPPEVSPEAYSRGGTSLFKYQAACPFQAFAYLRLGARPFDQVKDGLGPAERGTMLHAALEKLWQEVKGLNHWLSLDAEERNKVLAQSAESAVAEVRRERPDVVRGMMVRLEEERLKKLLWEWMELEESRSPFEVVATEEKVEIQFAGLNFRATIDRVDRLADGSLAVVDYKTGNPRIQDWLGERPKEPQLPIYCVTASQQVQTICFGVVRPGEMRFHGLGSQDDTLPGVKASEFAEDDDGMFDWQQRRARWNDVLSQLAEEFRSGRADPSPVHRIQTCRNCKLEPLCRIDEKGDLL